ncbi:bifunctional 5,10-methylenetetrahydrofolate dehydrogenase/5,10-methenyltetrahydrofolate cyclohydrolase [Actinoalloteichus sp. GBA129-24]|uniref:bifunctional 5,10-methylenetetrahydrofolate dehydrogenase/5,10-methenyltetrahydrofolate cyclohydrolase n=1 Tax=Actinoalloteichus sp. GBA129-24 TaxID=1612551 RepID=UPI0009505503|nr:bifunctional 5,10-methylenetetrahydrofolate dehydrogenase/5,10-methenyltetrahydrofolate cyclohydrolase [Actinoalloteichus sp. GBA129-24]APU21117.1 Bifunctional protein FolD [Actinoalloteichus sp. GBA129-24]
MTARLLSGTELAASVRADTTSRVAAAAAAGRVPRLTVVTATADEASAWYVRSIARAAKRTGIDCVVVDLGPQAAPSEIHERLAESSADPDVHGLMLQTPLPVGTSLAEAAQFIDPAKDVDGAAPASLGRLVAGLPAFAPATAAAVVALLDHHEVSLAGREVAIVGRSTVVGKPLAQLLLARDATVTLCHSRTRDLPAVTGRAEIVVAAVGRAGLLTSAHVRPGAVVVDVGTNPAEDGGLLGDVAPEVSEQAGALSPVPGGVGPVTTALLLRHAVEAAGW